MSDLGQWWVDDDPDDPDDSAQGRTPRLLADGTVALVLAPLAALVGVLLVIVGSAVLDHRPYGPVAGNPRVSYAEGSRTVRFARAGTYLGYVDTARQTADPGAGSLTIVPLDDAARVDAVRTVALDVSYRQGARHGRAAWKVRIRHAGVFEVQVRNPAAPASAALTFGRVSGVGLFAGVALVVPGALLLTVAVGLAVLGVLLRRRHRRAVGRAVAWADRSG